ncbi:MAG: eukaryotic translation initiation factor 6, partial [Marteilia pararefringens]
SLQSIFAFKEDFAHVPCSVNDISCIGIFVVGNNKGLVLPYTTTDVELQHITNCMPNDIRVHRLDEKLCPLTSLGNLVQANDTTGLASPQLSSGARNKIKEVLGLTDLFVSGIERYCLPGTYFCLNNFGLLAPKDLTQEEVSSLVSLLNLPVAQGSCADGKNDLGREFLVNTTHLLCDGQSFQLEIAVAKQIFAVNEAFINQNALRMPNKDDDADNIDGGDFQVLEDALLEAIL